MEIKKKLTLGCLGAGIMLLSGCSSDESLNDIRVPDNELTTRIDLSVPEIKVMKGLGEFNHLLMWEAAKLSEDGEFCISPVSISLSLGMLANASEGNCRAEILEALGTTDLSCLNSLSKKLMQYLPNDANGSSMNVANHIWVNNKFRVTDAFATSMRKWYYTGIDYVDFSKNSTFIDINNWVSDNTKGKISDIYEDHQEDGSMIDMLCANVVYFKGDWERKFSKSETKPGIFHSPSGAREVDMMHSERWMSYTEDETLQSISLDFEDTKNIMYLYLPKPGTDIIQCLQSLTPEKLDNLKRSLEDYKVRLSLPSFNVRSKLEVEKILSGMGINSLENADLSPMGLGERIVKMCNKSSLKIDEDGAELAAYTEITGLVSANTNDVKKEITLDFDRPFIYIIFNSATDAILMAGAVTNP